MGIKRMNKFLDSNNLIKKHNNINDFIKNNKKLEFQCFNTRNKCYRIAIDTMLYAHKFKYSYNDIVYGFANQIINFLSNRIIPIYIIDGIAPEEKNNIIKFRFDKKNKIDDKIENLELEFDKETNLELKKQIRKKINQLKKSNIRITKEDIDIIFKITEQFHVPCIRAKGEADALIGKLYINNSIDACLSEDMDLLIFGCKKMIKFQNKKIYEYDLDYILHKLRINFDQFLDMCLLFGCDYLKPIIKVNTQNIYNDVYENNINELIKNNIKEEYYEKYINDFNETKIFFKKTLHLEYSKFINFKLNTNINKNILEELSILSNEIERKKKEFFSDIFYINTLIKDNKFI